MPNILKSIAKAVGRAAPLLARTILGPAGDFGMNLVKDVLNIPDAAPEDIEKRLAEASPEDFRKLREAEQAHYRELYALDVEDRQSARQLATSKGIWVQASLSAAFTIGYAVIAVIFFRAMFGTAVEINDQLLGLFGTVFGVMSTALVQILNFWFGSTEGSRRKTDMDHLRQMRA